VLFDDGTVVSTEFFSVVAEMSSPACTLWPARKEAAKRMVARVDVNRAIGYIGIKIKEIELRSVKR
jgi:hypothetical protein